MQLALHRSAHLPRGGGGHTRGASVSAAVAARTAAACCRALPQMASHPAAATSGGRRRHWRRPRAGRARVPNSARAGVRRRLRATCFGGPEPRAGLVGSRSPRIAAPDLDEVHELAPQGHDRGLSLLLIPFRLRQLHPQALHLLRGPRRGRRLGALASPGRPARGRFIPLPRRQLHERLRSPREAHGELLVSGTHLLELPVQVLQGGDVERPGGDAAEDEVLRRQGRLRRHPLQPVDLDAAGGDLRQRQRGGEVLCHVAGGGRDGRAEATEAA
mmetsp:Transcript_29317/g.83376  ORF Transcript_29317/g.83376 Transcript_29317/m.83376 type:complete len:273 (-) Transcript_29317:68-886(-)